MNTDHITAAAERIVTAWQGVGGYPLDAPVPPHEIDAFFVAREYLRLLPFLQAVRDRRADWDAAEPAESALSGFAYAETLDRLSDAVCGEVTE